MPPSEPTTNDVPPATTGNTPPEPPVLATDEPGATPAGSSEEVPVAQLREEVVERDYEHVYEDGGGDFDFGDEDIRKPRPRRLALYVRILLLVMAVGFTAVIITAICLDPYKNQRDADGAIVLNEDGSKSAMTMETHRQLGLPRCNMVELTGKPCPACGMTTSFALLAHGDVPNSLKANWVGTLLCGTIILFTPWLVISGFRGRLLWVRNGEMFSTVILSALLLLMMGRWAWIMFVN